MIQRIQTIYLLLAVLSSIACLCLFWGAWILVLLLALSALFGAYTIFKYSNRKIQSKFCVFNILLLIGWYVVYIVLAQLCDCTTAFCIWSAILPLLSIVFYLLANRGIKADERLVREADRIR